MYARTKTELRNLLIRGAVAILLVLVASCGSTTTGDGVTDTGATPVDDVVPGSQDVVGEEEIVEEPPAELRFDSVEPSKGKVAGGEIVTIYGDGFEPGAQVLFDGSAGLFVFVLGPDRINVTTPPHSPGLARVTVVLPAQEKEISLDDAFLYYNDVSVTEVIPAVGPASGGTPVTVKGSGFTAETKLLIGPQLAINTQIIDDGTILGLTPGGEAGTVDIFVSTPSGIGTLKDGYQYTAPPEVNTVVPAAGPTAGGQTVTLSGTGFVEPFEVRLGTTLVNDIELVNDNTIEITTPPSAAGSVDIWVTTSYGASITQDGYMYYDTPPTGVEILNVVPNSGPILGGTEVVVTAAGLGSSLDTSIRFGNQPAEIQWIDPVTQSALVVSPAVESEGPVTVSVYSPSGSGVMENGFTYTSTFAVAGVSPNYGPLEGGTDIVVTGMGFAADAEVFVAALPAQNVQVVSDTEIHAVTPPGSPGFAKVEVAQGLESADLANGFFYTSGGTDIYVVTPDKGSIAGGTQLDVLGIGFTDDSTVYVGGEQATHVTFIDPTRLNVRTPPGEIGTVDVRVETPIGDAVLQNGYTYYDPVSLYGGTWGEPVEVALNVTVLKAGDGSGVPDAFVIVGSEPQTPYQGFTNLNGQITFSGPNLEGEQMVSVSKEGYENNSVVAFDAENVTIYLTELSPPSMGPGAGIAPPLVRGQVFGLGKYIVGPPGPCSMGQGSDPSHCLPCDSDSQCGIQGAACFDIGSQGKRCLMACNSDQDCPSNAACQNYGEASRCVPTPGTKVVVCEGTKPSMFAQRLPPGNGAVVSELGTYEILAYPGEVAIVCLGGFMDNVSDPVDPAYVLSNMIPYFTPVVMGVYRHLNLIPGEIAEDINIDLNIPLSRTLKLRLEDPPLDVADFLYGWIYYDFGSDGVFQAPVAPFAYSDNTLFVEGQPVGFAGDIEDASYTIMAGAMSFTEDNTPYSVVLRRDLTEPEDDRMLLLDEGEWNLLPTGITRNLLGAWGETPETVFAVGTDGSIYRFNGTAFNIQPSTTDKVLRAIHGSANDNVWVVGDGGIVLSFNGLTWTEDDSGVTSNFRDVFAADNGEVFVAGNYMIRRRTADGVWSFMPAPSGSWYGIHGTSADDVWLVGNVGRVNHYNGTSWTSKQVPTPKGLRAVHALAPDNVWIVGEAGTILHFDGENFEVMESLTNRTLTSISARGPNDIYVVGGRGVVLHYDGVTWANVSTPDFSQNLNEVVAFADDSTVLTFGDHELFLGPMVPIPVMQNPTDGGVLDGDFMSWITSDGVEPHFQYKKIGIPSLMGDTPVWTFISGGDINAVALPDFQNIEGTPGIPGGLLRFTFFRVFKEGFDIDHFDYSDLNTLDWQAWAYDTMLFMKMEP
ncbi:MAG: hypothetical protein CMH54_12670 [Myxococcales bacterium]|nr:hypothetical protein [Myxococcales bacterium]